MLLWPGVVCPGAVCFRDYGEGLGRGCSADDVPLCFALCLVPHSSLSIVNMLSVPWLGCA